MDGCTTCAVAGNVIGTTMDGLSAAGGTTESNDLCSQTVPEIELDLAVLLTTSTLSENSEPSPVPNLICAYGNGADMFAISHETGFTILDKAGLNINGAPLGHPHVYMNVGGSSSTNTQSTGIHLPSLPIPNCDRPDA